MDTELPEITFPVGLPGFPDVRRFMLEQWGGADSPFSLLRCLDEGLEFLVVPPDEFFPDYAPVVDDEMVEALDLRGSDEAIVLVIVTVPERTADATANLLGPVIVNTRTHQARQIVLSDRWSTRHRLMPASH